MEKYETLGVVGEGSYGVVLKCKHKETNQIVAIKKFLESEDDKVVKKIARREIKVLKMLHHDHIVNLIEVFKRRKRFYLVFEFIDHTILNEIDKFPHGIDELTARKILWQVLKGIEFFHAHNIIHRDLKPENILISRAGIVKVCDFGFARTIVSSSKAPYTGYVATRWYRAPELLVGDTKYGKAVDIWAVGCIVAEILCGDPLFPGDSDLDQIYQIIRCLGDLIPQHKALFAKNPSFSSVRIPEVKEKKSIRKRFSKFSSDAVLFIEECLNLDPNYRPTCTQLLKKGFFQKDSFCSKFPQEIRAKIHREKHSKHLQKVHHKSSDIVKYEEKKNKQKEKEAGKENNGRINKKPTEVSKWFSIFPHVEQEKKLTHSWNEDNAILRPDHCTISDAMPPISHKYISKQSIQTIPMENRQSDGKSSSSQSQQRFQFLQHHFSSLYARSGQSKIQDRLSHFEKKKIKLNEPEKRNILILPKMESYEQSHR
ncbi:cyclin-dependent kinase-like 4 [Octopus sinensis]|uniref:cyclin-dependent kinase n=1 Tax=Octopus sinensis TaxID=2607531 RepID=A0A7E6ESW4_9MOLL|nr:cyclin-dependent kinase-like 4 [Octopus sinensis]